MTDRQKTRQRPNLRRAFGQTYGSLLAEGLDRRAVVKGFLASTALAALGAGHSAASENVSSLKFEELKRVRDTKDHWPQGYDRQVLLRWGDPLFADSPAFDLATINGPATERQFGYNNDFTAFIPLPHGSQTSDHGLLIVSHEYADPYLMFPGLTDEDYREKLTDAQIRTIMAAT